jgi:putative transposase
MKQPSRYSRSFYSDGLSDTKYREIHALAVSIQEVKNEISEIVNQNPFHYLEMSKYQFQKEMLPLVKNRISGHFVNQLLCDIYTSYQNKFKNIKTRLKFQHIKEYNFTYYKRNGKTKSGRIYKAGDFKGISIKHDETPLSITLTYLARYGYFGIVDYLLEKFVQETNQKKELFYATLLDTIYKFGFTRIFAIAISKRNRIIKHYSERPIEFKSLSFRGRSRLSNDIVSMNDNKKSTINSFANISWYTDTRKKMTIPMKYSKDFHGELKRYTNGTATSYTICLEENDQIRMILSYEDEREYPEAKDRIIGIDVNSKHNLMTCSNGYEIDFDRELVEVLSNELQKIDKLKENKNYVIGRKRQHKIDHLNRELQSKIREEIASLCKRLKDHHYHHAVFEDLDNQFGSTFAKDENDLNYNRRLKLLHLGSLKDEFKHIARKYGIAVSLVQSFYTSQTCPKCGCIDKENRKDQEHFECVECGYKSNADLNASRNIKQRVVSTVLRDELLKKSNVNSSAFTPKVNSKEKTLEVLELFRNNLICV